MQWFVGQRLENCICLGQFKELEMMKVYISLPKGVNPKKNKRTKVTVNSTEQAKNLLLWFGLEKSSKKGSKIINVTTTF